MVRASTAPGLYCTRYHVTRTINGVPTRVAEGFINMGPSDLAGFLAAVAGFPDAEIETRADGYAVIAAGVAIRTYFSED